MILWNLLLFFWNWDEIEIGWKEKLEIERALKLSNGPEITAIFRLFWFWDGIDIDMPEMILRLKWYRREKNEIDIEIEIADFGSKKRREKWNKLEWSQIQVRKINAISE